MIVFSILAAVLAVAAIGYLVVALVEAGALLMAPDAVTIWLGVLQFATLAPHPRPPVPPARRLHGPRLHRARRTWRSSAASTALIGVDPALRADAGGAYLRGVLAFSVVGVLFVYALQRLQAVLPYSLGLPAVPEGLAFNTAISFVTNTNWQSYSPELTLGYTVQLAGLAVQNFVSAAVGIAVAIALVRGFARRRSGDDRQLLGRPHPRHRCGILLPLSVVAAVVADRRRRHPELQRLHRRAPRSPAATQSIPGGPVASQEAIKLLGTNGGGFFNANSAHPFENPTRLDQPVRDLPDAGDPVRLPRTFGKMVGDHRQGYAILAVMASIFVVSIVAADLARGARQRHRAAARRRRRWRARSSASASSARRCSRTSTTLTSTGAVNSMHDSLHRARRHAADDQHDARRGRPRRRRLRASTGSWCSPSSRCSSPA